jgi:23S rRNA (uracil1939-C5)-methyltransferase
MLFAMQLKPRYNQKINTTIKRIGINGEGVGYWHQYTVFIDGALPGEVVQARVIESKKRYGRGRLTVIDNPSPHRVKPICSFFGRCGGCQLMHLDYTEQLNIKRQRVVDALERIGKITDAPVLPCLPSPLPFNYRNKIQIPILPDGNAGIKMGLYARHSHDLVEMDHCHIHCAIGEQIWKNVSSILKNSQISAYDWNTHQGVLRHLIIKTAVNTKQALVVIVTNGIGPDSLRLVAQDIMHACPSVKGVIQNINNNPDNVVLSEEFQLLAGSFNMEEQLCGMKFAVSAASFFQVNPAQAEQLYAKALEFAELSGKETVLDAYCGVGTLSLLFAAKTKRVLGIECIPQAVEDAKENARLNALNNVTFICDQAEIWIKQAPVLDLVLLNPPRKGCDPVFLEEIVRLSPNKIIYISCDPATLARDLAFLVKNHYAIKIVQPLDMFPQTAHVECIVQIQKTIF